MKRSDRRALLLLFTIILSVWAGILLDRHLLRPSGPAPASLDQVAMEHLAPPAEAQAKSGDTATASAETAPAETFPFDPNTADSATLRRLGLPAWMARAIGRYRAKGGRYHRPEDFKRVPGMTPELYERLQPAIHIGRAFRYYADLEPSETAPASPHETVRHDSSHSKMPHGPRQEKFREMVCLDLNSVDTTELKKVPGIGSYRARQIVRYRERLGGFTSVEQLAEVEDFPSELAEWFRVEASEPQRLNINTATFGQLARHPYIGAQRARTITDYRRAHGKIHALSDLQLLDGFAEADLQRLQPYVTY